MACLLISSLDYSSDHSPVTLPTLDACYNATRQRFQLAMAIDLTDQRAGY